MTSTHESMNKSRKNTNSNNQPSGSVQNQCYICQKESVIPSIQFNCSHSICPSCLSHDLILNQFKSLENKQDILFSCKCHSGTCQLPFEDFIEIMKELTKEKEKGSCRKHNNPGQQYCTECELWLCEQCLTIHSEFNSHHKLTERELPIKKVCVDHGELCRFYCNQCMGEICASCVLKSGKHKDHKYFDLDEFAIITYEIKQKFKNKTANDFTVFYDDLCKGIILNINEQIDFTMKKFDDIYTQLELIKNEYRHQMENHKEKATKVFEIIKYCYYYFYKEINRDYQDKNTVNYLSQVSELSSIKGFFKESNALDQVLYHLNAFGNLSYYKYQINNVENPYPFEQVHVDALKKTSSMPSASMSASIKKAVNIANNNNPSSNMSAKKELKDIKLETRDANLNDFVYAILKLREGNTVAVAVGKEIQVYQDILYDKTDKYSLTGHTKNISCLAQLGDDRIISGSEDKTMKIWNLESKECVSTITGKFELVMCIIVLSNGSIAVGSHNTIRIYNPDSKEELYTLVGHERSVSALIQSNNNTLISSSYDNMIKIWDLNSQMCDYTLFGHDQTVYCIIVLKDGRLASGSGSWEKTIKVWSIKNKKSEFNLVGHQREVRALVQISTGSLVSCSMDKTIKVWNLQNKTCIQTLTVHEDVVYALDVFSEGRFISGSRDKSIAVWKHKSIQAQQNFTQSQNLNQTQSVNRSQNESQSQFMKNNES